MVGFMDELMDGRMVGFMDELMDGRMANLMVMSGYLEACNMSPILSICLSDCWYVWTNLFPKG